MLQYFCNFTGECMCRGGFVSQLKAYRCHFGGTCPHQRLSTENLIEHKDSAPAPSLDMNLLCNHFEAMSGPDTMALRESWRLMRDKFYRLQAMEHHHG